MELKYINAKMVICVETGAHHTINIREDKLTKTAVGMWYIERINYIGDKISVVLCMESTASRPEKFAEIISYYRHKSVVVKRVNSQITIGSGDKVIFTPFTTYNGKLLPGWAEMHIPYIILNYTRLIGEEVVNVIDKNNKVHYNVETSLLELF